MLHINKVCIFIDNENKVKNKQPMEGIFIAIEIAYIQFHRNTIWILLPYLVSQNSKSERN